MLIIEVKLFLVLEIVEELGNTRKSWLALTFYLDGKLDAGLADTTEILNLMECCHEANTRTGDDRLTETHLIHTIVYEHLDVVYLDDLLPEIRQYREGEVAVSDGAVVRAFYLGALYIYVNPLWVEGCVCKLVDTVLVDLQPV